MEWDQEKFSPPAGESVLTLLCFGTPEAARAAADMIDTTSFADEALKDIADRAVAFIAAYGDAPGKAHIDELFAHVLQDPAHKQRDYYRHILVTVLQHSERINERYALDHMALFARKTIISQTAIAVGRRYQGGGDEAAMVADGERLFEEALMRCAGLKCDDGMLVAVNAGADKGDVPPRGWLLGTVFCKGTLSGLVSDGGVGKTSLRLVQLLALASGRPLLGEHVFKRCRVLYLCLEDDLDEIRRRIRAAMMHHQVSHDEIDGYFYFAPIATTSWKLMAAGDKSLDRRLRRFIAAYNIDLVTIDPFIKSHSEDENDNRAVDKVVTVLMQIAQELDVAADTLQHERKGGAPEPGDANRARGASSYKDALRLLKTMTVVSREHADALGIDEAERPFIRRVDPGKVNTAPPNERTQWFKLVGVRLGNSTPEYPNGDTVQTVETWTPPDPRDGLPDGAVDHILAEIAAGPGDGWMFAARAIDPERSAWRVVQKHLSALPEPRCREIIDRWLGDGTLEEYQYKTPQRRFQKGLRPGKRADLRKLRNCATAHPL